MSRNTRRGSLVGFGAVAVVLIASSVAWACSPAARIDCAGATTSEGPPGTRVQINGCAFYNDQPVEIRWDSATGPVLGKAVGKEWSLGVTVPTTATAGSHQFVAVFRYAATEGGEVRRELQSAFTVTPGSRDTTGGSSGVVVTAGGGSGGEAADAAVPAQAPVAQPAPAATGVPASSAAPAAAASAGTATIPAQQAVAPSANPGAVRTPAGRVVFGGSTPPVAAQAPAAAQPATSSDEESAAQPVSRRTASGDLFSGFQAGTSADRALGLQAGTPADTDSATSVAAALFGAGMMALFAGFGAAELGRRRALAHTGNRPLQP